MPPELNRIARARLTKDTDTVNMTRFAYSFSMGLILALAAAAIQSPCSCAADAGIGSRGPKSAAVTADQNAFFESKIRPILVKSCLSCHGEQKRGGLRLDSRKAVLNGGARGMVVIEGDPENSRLVDAVRYVGPVHMPPAGKLRADEIASLAAWVKIGAPWPGVIAVCDAAVTPSQATAYKITDAQKSFWSFQPVVKPLPPSVKNPVWCVSPIDRFVLSMLESRGLKPAGTADRRTLIRRVTFDLVGLPPLPEDVESFVRDKSPDAWRRVIDRLLASPQYGERWGRHWLDLVRYADSNGLDENVAFAHAYRYRDYVVKSFNQDKPYNDFVCEQLAGDLMPSDSDEVRNDRLTATGFLSLGPKLLAEPDKPKMVMDIVDEQIEVTSKAFLGLTVTCARCHNHKFDPIPTKDYYALAGIFKSTKTMSSLSTVAMWSERPLHSKEHDALVAASEHRLRDAQARLDQIRDRANSSLLASIRSNRTLPSSNHAVLPEHPEKLYSEEVRRSIVSAEKTVADIKAGEVKPDMVMAVEDTKAENCRVHIRGDTQNLGDEVPRHLLTVLGGDRIVVIDPNRSGRIELARWITRPEHPLTSRVEANRIWQGHFGTGLVQTPDNWGFLGLRPTNPKLLDWLAATFVESGWSIKKMHRLILMSNTYKMGANPDSATAETASKCDPDNTLLWKMPRRRLEAEPFRDSLLFVSGKLDLTVGGTLLGTPNHDYVTNDQSGNAANYNAPRRSLYLPIIRNALFDMFQAFDYGDPSMVNTRRSTTTVAPQALYVMNSPFVMDRARDFAESLLSPTRITDGDRLKVAYLRAYGRPPAVSEIRKGLAYIDVYSARVLPSAPDAAKARLPAWSSFCQILFASNEFIYIN